MNEILCAKTNKPPINQLDEWDLKNAFSVGCNVFLKNGDNYLGRYFHVADCWVLYNAKNYRQENILYFQVIPTLEEIENSKL